MSPVSMMGWSFIGLAMFQATALAMGVLCLPTVIAPFAKEDWVAVKELKLSYYVGETLLFTIYIYTYIPIMVA